MPTTLRPHPSLKPTEKSHLHHVPNRRPRIPDVQHSLPAGGPFPSGVSSSDLSAAPSVSPRRTLLRLPFVPPMPRGSIPESKTIISYFRHHRTKSCAVP